MSSENSFLLEKARKFCAYQERCFQDVRMKLSEWKASEKTIEQIIRQLEKEDYLNEERYAISFALGKFRQNKWGKNKIFYALSQKNIPEIYIQIGLNEISDEDQIVLLKALLKSKKINEDVEYRRNHKLVAYAVQKGFPASLAWKAIRGDV
jgi:regulatory protein